MTKKPVIALIIFAILAVIALVFSQAPLSIVGDFTMASFELDDYGLIYGGGEPLSFASTNDGWQDNQNKFLITSSERPFTTTTNLQVPACIPSGNGLCPEADLKINTVLTGKDVKAVFSAGEFRNIDDILERIATFTLYIDGTCQRIIKTDKDTLHVVEWRSSNLQQDYGAFFVDDVKVCEKIASNNDRIHVKISDISPAINKYVEARPELNLYAVGQRLPYNCRLDYSHEVPGLERFSAGQQINLQTLGFEPVAFCKDWPVEIASTSGQGLTSTAEPFLRWAEGKTLQVPEGDVWLVQYAFDWKRAGLSQGCAEGDRYLVGEKKCENEASIVVITQNTDGSVRADSLMASGKSIEEVVVPPETELVMLDEAPSVTNWMTKETLGIMNYWFVIIGFIILIILLVFYFKTKNKRR